MNCAVSRQRLVNQQNTCTAPTAAMLTVHGGGGAELRSNGLLQRAGDNCRLCAVCVDVVYFCLSCLGG